MNRKQPLYVFLNKGAILIYFITLFVSCIGLILDAFKMHSLSVKIIYINLTTGTIIISALILYLFKIIKLPASFAITSYTLIANFIYAFFSIHFGDFEVIFFLRSLFFFIILVVLTYIIVNKLNGIIQTVIQITYVIIGTMKIGNHYLNDSLILFIFVLLSFSGITYYIVHLFRKNIHELLEKNNIIEKQNNDLNESNTLLEERQQQIEEQTEELLAQKEQLTEMNKELEETVATKNKFFSIIAHDLKNPINTLLGFTQLLYNKYDNYNKEKIASYLKIIFTSTHNINNLIKNLLIWSRMQTGKIKENPTKIVLIDEVNKACELLENTYKQKKINIVVDINSSLKVNADLYMLSSVLHNLITNAIKFTNAGGTITISAEQDKKEFAKISVSDTGIGIAEENIPKLFRTDQSYTTEGTNEEKGTGLGLLLCKEFIQKNGGEIWVESKEKKGSQFFFTLPVYKDN